MAIVVRSQGGKWQKATKVEFTDEAQLQKLLYDSPELIPRRMTKTSQQCSSKRQGYRVPATQTF